MADPRAVFLVLAILVAGGSVGALAGYRLVLTDETLGQAEPVTANVTIDWPDGSRAVWNGTVAGVRAHALGALEAAAADLDISLGVRHTSFGSYVHTIGEYRAKDRCGWMYAMGGLGLAHEPDQAADLEPISDGSWVAWYWGCI